MQEKKLYYRLGLFVAGALVLLLGALFFLGVLDEFEPRIKFATLFRESVQGLTKGAAVKYKGVPIGTVEAITILTDEKLIRVDMSIDPSVFCNRKLFDNDDQQDEAEAFCNTESMNGLYCRLELAGVTGFRYIEMDYFQPPADRVRPEPIKEPDVIYFASVPCTFTNIVDSVGTSLSKIARVDYQGISEKLDKNLSNLNQLLSDPALKVTIDRLESIAGNVDVFSRNLSENLTGQDLRRILDGLNQNLEELKSLSSNLHQKINEFDSKTLGEKVALTLTEVKQLVSGLDRTRGDFDRTLQLVMSFLSNSSELVEYLKQHPDSLLRGQQSQPVDME